MTTTIDRRPAAIAAAVCAVFLSQAAAAADVPNTVRERVEPPAAVAQPQKAKAHPAGVVNGTPVDAAAAAAGDVQSVGQSELRFIDRIVAVVNNDIITEYELQNRVRQTAINLREQNIELPPMPELRRQVLERLIMEKCIDQRSRELGIRVDERMVTAAIEQIARNNKITVEELRQKLQADDVSFSVFRDQVREEISAQRLREREVDSKLTIPESEVDAYLAEQAGFTSGDTQEYRVQHILLPIPSGATDSEAEDVGDEAERIADEARKGEDFAKLAAAHSKASDAMKGGDLGWMDASKLPSFFWKAIEEHRTERGFVTVLRSSGAWHVLKLVDTRDGVKAKLAGAPVEQTHVRHILMFVSDISPESEVVSKLNAIKHRIESGQSDFATMARLTSVDNSATRGGDIGWIGPGEASPEFEAAMNKLSPGEISEPIHTQYGYHLIQVIERRTAQANAERSRLAARMALREKKLAEAVYNWQRELRDKAYVEIRRDAL